MGDSPAWLASEDGSVWLSPHGARLVYVALKLQGVYDQARTGVAPKDDVGALAAVIKWAVDRANGSRPGTSGQRFVVTMPASGSKVTVAEAAEIWQVSPRAIRKAVAEGRLQAERHGTLLLLDEYEVRHATADRRRRPGRDCGRAQAGPGDRERREDVG